MSTLNQPSETNANVCGSGFACHRLAVDEDRRTVHVEERRGAKGSNVAGGHHLLRANTPSIMTS